MAVFRVLSLDGGGMRGIYSAAFLDRLARYYATARGVDALDIGKGFDLITGTSTGAIVACALAIGKPMSEVVALYRKEGPKIFPHRISGKGAAIKRVTMGRSPVREGDAALRRALTKVLGKKTIGDVYSKRNIALAIPAVKMSQHLSYVFKKTAKSGNRDDKVPLVDACMASSAAPIYRSLAAIKDPNASYKDAPPLVFADGGLWANNPALVGLLDALLSAPKDKEIEIFSLGTCPRPEGEHWNSKTLHRTMLEWWLGAKVAPLSIAAQEFAYDNMTRMFANILTDLGRPVRWLRFPKGPMPAELLDYLDLDDTRKEAMDRLITQANNDADVTKSACDDSNNKIGQMIRSAFDSFPEMPKAGLAI